MYNIKRAPDSRCDQFKISYVNWPCSHQMPNKPTAFRQNPHGQQERHLSLALRKTWSILRLPVRERGRTRLKARGGNQVKSSTYKAEGILSIYCCQLDTCNTDDNRCQSMIGRLTHITFPEMKILTSVYPREQLTLHM